jgi:DNA-binding response OmpR family regulator
VRILVENCSAFANAEVIFLLKQQGYGLTWIRSAEDLLGSLERYQYDMVILDWETPTSDTLAIIKQIRLLKQKLPIIVLGKAYQLDAKLKCLHLGADDYLAKPFAPAELGAHVKALIRRSKYDTQNELQFGPVRYDVGGKRVYFQNQAIPLSAKETNLFDMLVSHLGHIVSKDEIVKYLYGWNPQVDNKVIEVYIHRLRKKLQPSGFKLKTVRGMGYVIELPA